MSKTWLAAIAVLAVVAVGVGMATRTKKMSLERRETAFVWGDKEKMLPWARAGDKEAQYHLGRAFAQKYRESRGTDAASCEQALFWFDKAVAQAVPGAKMEIARMQYWGECMEKDQVQALITALALAKEGLAEAQLFIGNYFYASGRPDASPSGLQVPPELTTTGSSRDREEKAVPWYLRAAEQDYLPAMEQLAGTYLSGPLRDPAKADHWRNLADRKKAKP
jgi:TPR repeat protein